MRTATLFAVTASLMGQALADFWVYKQIQYFTADATNLGSFGIYTGPPDCNAVYNGQLYTIRDDVSGSKYGIRCKGCSTAEDADVKTTELELNDEGFGHFSKSLSSLEQRATRPRQEHWLIYWRQLGTPTGMVRWLISTIMSLVTATSMPLTTTTASIPLPPTRASLKSSAPLLWLSLKFANESCELRNQS